MAEIYECSFCKATNVKLWRPFGYAAPLICAKCAEQKQSPYKSQLEQEERILPRPRWFVSDSGFIKSYHDKTQLSHRLIVDLDDSRKFMDMIPAVPANNGEFWGYIPVPQEELEKWEQLPNQIISAE